MPHFNTGIKNLYQIITVCVGNICRSPLAEGLLKHYLQDRSNDFDISSAGVGALVGSPAADYSLELAEEHGLDISEHRARQLTPEMVLDSDLILVMESSHRQEIVKHTPQARGKVMLVGQWEKLEIPDPYRKPKQAFVDAYTLIDRGIQSWIKKL